MKRYTDDIGGEAKIKKMDDVKKELNIAAFDSDLQRVKSLVEKNDILNSRAFLFTVARNLIIDWYRKKKSVSFEDISFDEEGGYDPSDEMTTEHLFIKAEGRYFFEKINELTSINRQPVYLRYVEDLSPPEIGEILGISANTASVRINRGIEELRKKVGDKFN
jgi:RNA polymerase sigma factor (sigma-70 family)